MRTGIPTKDLHGEGHGGQQASPLVGGLFLKSNSRLSLGASFCRMAFHHSPAALLVPDPEDSMF